MFICRKTLDIGRQAWYHTGMCATCNNEETPRPEPRCPRCGNSEDAPNSHDLCENCVEAMEDDYEDDSHPYGYDVEFTHPDFSE